MKHFRRGHLVSLASSLALFVGSAKADTMAAGAPATNFTVGTYVSGLTTPTSFAFLPSGLIMVTDKEGQVYTSDGKAAPKLVGTFQVDTASEKGLLHVILHPDFATNRLLIFYYSAADAIGGTDLDRHRVVTIPLKADGTLDLTKETILVRGLRGPANHDGGALALGPDGKLYIGDGDTGCNSNLAPLPVYTPTNFFATCLTVPNGKILRVNLDGSIPADNPLVNAPDVTACGTTCGTDATTLAPATGTAIRKDIWAWGFRNPWRFWFDSKTGNLWVGDVGEVTYEEVDVIPPSGKGKHYGWPWREGIKGHAVNTCQNIVPNAGDCVDPQYSCSHGTSGEADIDSNCQALIGGAIVDSCSWPKAFQGLYYFGDNSRKWIATLTPTADRNGISSPTRTPFVNTTGGPSHIDIGPDGALYYTSIGQGSGSGTVMRVAPKNPVACAAPADGGVGSGGASNAGGASSAGGTATAGASNAGGANSGAGGGGIIGGGTVGGFGGGGTTGSAGGATQGGAGTTGTAGSTAGGPSAGAPNGAVDGSTGSAASGDTGGCGCRIESNSGRDGAALGSLLAGALVLARRRRRRA